MLTTATSQLVISSFHAQIKACACALPWVRPRGPVACSVAAASRDAGFTTHLEPALRPVADSKKKQVGSGQWPDPTSTCRTARAGLGRVLTVPPCAQSLSTDKHIIHGVAEAAELGSWPCSALRDSGPYGPRAAGGWMTGDSGGTGSLPADAEASRSIAWLASPQVRVDA